MPVWGLARLAWHLIVGLLKVALWFPFLDEVGRERRVQRWSRQLVAICGVSFSLDDRAQREPVSPALIVCNHISWLDIFVMNTIHPCRFVAKSDIRGWPLIGWLCENTGTIFIARGKQRDVRRIYAGLVKSIHDGERVAFFPEGTTAPQGTVLPFHANLFEAAIEAEVPVQPYALRYLDADGSPHDSADFIGEMTFVESVIAILQSGGMRAELIRLPAIPTEGAHRRELAAAARALISNALRPVTGVADIQPAPTYGQTSAAR
ncbi:MAG: lysophospholipid acyltransferase family protein [Oxalobacteraceae bacterium]